MPMRLRLNGGVLFAVFFFFPHRGPNTPPCCAVWHGNACMRPRARACVCVGADTMGCALSPTARPTWLRDIDIK